MKTREAIYQRRSIRAFLPEPVAKKTLLQVVDAAIQAPSARNLQPWHFVVVSGPARQRLSQRLLKQYDEEVAQGLISPPLELPEPYQSRMNCFLSDLQAHYQGPLPFDLMRGSLNFYGAPAVILATLDECLWPDRLFDMGAAVQNLLLMAQALGLGTCVIGIAIRYKHLIREELQLPASLNPVMTIAVGKPDPAHPLATFHPGRLNVAECLTWLE